VLTVSALLAACGMSVRHDHASRGHDPVGTGGAGGPATAGAGGTIGGEVGASQGGEASGEGGRPTANGGGETGESGAGAANASAGASAKAGGGFGGAGTAGMAAGGLAGGGGFPTIGGYTLYGAPLVFAPTQTGFGLSVVLASGDPSLLSVRIRQAGTDAWGDFLSPEVRAPDLAEWHLGDLQARTSYEYEILGSISARGADVALSLFRGSVTTTRSEGDSFSFALLTDTHIGSDLSYSNQGDTNLLAETSAQMGAVAPDFVVNLGDMLDFHEYGFNTPPPDGSITRAAYLNYRATYGAPLASMPHFAVIGGWDSESGCNTADEIDRSRTQRLLYLPGPTPDTYPEGGSPFEDYYAFTWGDALFVVLNVYTYTPTCHLLDTYPGVADDWTLGDAQMEWLRTTLENATSKWRFLLIHHPVGGNGGNDVDSAYGRGGGRAAHVGEQEIVHELMQEHGVQSFFYGHDHVFTDMIVDNIHYSLPGSAGAIWIFTPDETGYSYYWPNSGWARVDVTPDDVHVQFLDVSGSLLHDYTLP
jgi:hypothetical protein